MAFLLTGCRTEYRGPYSDIDGVLWRQVASVEDPFNAAIFEAQTSDPQVLLDQLPAVRWNSSDAIPDLDDPRAVVYDVELEATRATFSVFFSSGTRPDAPAESGAVYAGPDSVFTCALWTVELGSNGVEDARRGTLGQSWEDCPRELVEAMPGDVAFAEPGVFDG